MRANHVLPNVYDLGQRLEAAALHFDPFSDGFAAVDLVIDLADEVFDVDCDRCDADDDNPMSCASDGLPGDQWDSEPDNDDLCPAGDHGGSRPVFERTEGRGDRIRRLLSTISRNGGSVTIIAESGLSQLPDGSWIQGISLPREVHYRHDGTEELREWDTEKLVYRPVKGAGQ